jgi:hypothetical protein
VRFGCAASGVALLMFLESIVFMFLLAACCGCHIHHSGSEK